MISQVIHVYIESKFPGGDIFRSKFKGDCKIKPLIIITIILIASSAKAQVPVYVFSGEIWTLGSFGIGLTMADAERIVAHKEYKFITPLIEIAKGSGLHTWTTISHMGGLSMTYNLHFETVADELRIDKVTVIRQWMVKERAETTLAFNMALRAVQFSNGEHPSDSIWFMGKTKYTLRLEPNLMGSMYQQVEVLEKIKPNRKEN